MKKIIILLFLVIGILSLVQAQKTYPVKATKDYIYMSGFDGEKPLKQDKNVEVFLVTYKGTTMFLEDHKAYKGETEAVFAKRFLETYFYKKDTRALKSQLKQKVASIVKKKTHEFIHGPLFVYFLFC